MEENIKELEQVRDNLDKRIRQHYIDEEKKRIQLNEEKYVGKCYKIENNGSTVYMKMLSGLTSNTYCYMHCMEFKLPIDPKFKPIPCMHNNKKFEYGFISDVLNFEDVLIKPIYCEEELINKRIEITIEEFENALKEFGKQLLKLSREDFTLNGKYFKN